MREYAVDIDGYPPKWLNNERFIKWFRGEIENKDNKFEKYATKIIENELMNDKIDSDIGLIFLTAYIEIISEYFVGTDFIYGFLLHCF